MSEPGLLRPEPLSEEPLNLEAPLPALRSEITPTNLCFIRSHFDLPRLDPSSWNLAVGGAVQTPLSLSLAQLRERRLRSITVTLECAGNARTSMDPVPPGTPWGRGAVSTVRFRGTPLAAVLESAGVRDEAVEVLFVGADEGTTKAGTVETYARSTGLETALHPDTMLAWEMNGRPLLPEHGAPLRLVVPGWYGMASVKWLREVKVLTSSFRGFFQTEEYVMRGCDTVPEDTPLSRIAVNSLILDPTPSSVLRGEPVEISGIAWSGRGPVTSVEVSTDGGVRWEPATLASSRSPWAHQAWRRPWRPSGRGRHSLAVRATDAAGRVQPTLAAWNRLGYGNNGIHVVEVVVD